MAGLPIVTTVSDDAAQLTDSADESGEPVLQRWDERRIGVVGESAKLGLDEGAVDPSPFPCRRDEFLGLRVILGETLRGGTEPIDSVTAQPVRRVDPVHGSSGEKLQFPIGDAAECQQDGRGRSQGGGEHHEFVDGDVLAPTVLQVADGAPTNTAAEFVCGVAEPLSAAVTTQAFDGVTDTIHLSLLPVRLSHGNQYNRQNARRDAIERD